MKNIQILPTSFMMILLLFSVSLFAQRTYQFDLYGEMDNCESICGHYLTGNFTYHVMYHVDKSGYMVNLHWNVKESNLVDAVTGEKFRTVDCGNDKLGIYWDFFNNLHYYNTGYPIYYPDVEDGWLPVPAEMPAEGNFVNLSWKLIGNKGQVYTWKSLVQVTINANMEMTAYVVKDELICD